MEIGDKEKDMYSSKYIITYNGTKEEFDNNYLEQLNELRCMPFKYIELGEETIVMLKCRGDEIGKLEEKLADFENGNIFIEKDRQVKASKDIL